jgi:hypothetical protein
MDNLPIALSFAGMAARSKSTRRTASPAGAKKRSAPTRATARRGTPRRWSKQVMETSDAMDLEAGVFKKKDPRAIALSVKRSAERSKRRKSAPFRSAMSMLTFYVNRGGSNLSAADKKRLLAAKDELRRLYGKQR